MRAWPAMPELPEVQGLVDFLDERLAGLAVESLELASFSVLKTFDPPPQALEGAPVDGVVSACTYYTFAPVPAGGAVGLLEPALPFVFGAASVLLLASVFIAGVRRFAHTVAAGCMSF